MQLLINMPHKENSKWTQEISLLINVNPAQIIILYVQQVNLHP